MRKNFRTEKAKELYNTLKTIKEKMKELDHDTKKIYFEYFEMDGKYGIKVYGARDMAQGTRGYHCEYANEKAKQKEKNEREQYLKDNLYYEKRAEYDRLSKEYDRINEEWYIEEYQMTHKEKEYRANLERAKKELKKAKENIKYWETKIEELKEGN